MKIPAHFEEVCLGPCAAISSARALPSAAIFEGPKDLLHSAPDILRAHSTLLLSFEAINVVNGEHPPGLLDLCLVFGGDLVLLREFAPPCFGRLFAC